MAWTVLKRIISIGRKCSRWKKFGITWLNCVFWVQSWTTVNRWCLVDLSPRVFFFFLVILIRPTNPGRGIAFSTVYQRGNTWCIADVSANKKKWNRNQNCSVFVRLPAFIKAHVHPKTNCCNIFYVLAPWTDNNAYLLLFCPSYPAFLDDEKQVKLTMYFAVFLNFLLLFVCLISTLENFGSCASPCESQCFRTAFGLSCFILSGAKTYYHLNQLEVVARKAPRYLVLSSTFKSVAI